MISFLGDSPFPSKTVLTDSQSCNETNVTK